MSVRKSDRKCIAFRYPCYGSRFGLRTKRCRGSSRPFRRLFYPCYNLTGRGGRFLSTRMVRRTRTVTCGCVMRRLGGAFGGVRESLGHSGNLVGVGVSCGPLGGITAGRLGSGSAARARFGYSYYNHEMGMLCYTKTTGMFYPCYKISV